MAGSKELITRTRTGILLIAVLIAALWLDNIILPLFIILFMIFASNEYLRFWHRKDVYPHTLAVLFPGFAIPFIFFLGIPPFLPLCILFFFVILLSITRFPGSRYKPNFLTEITAALFGIAYLSLMPSTIILLRKMGFAICLMPLILTWLYDTFAYLVGSTWGRHKMVPLISPKKSWEGTLTALILTFPCAWLLNRIWLKHLNILDAAFITLGIGFLGTFADLLESGMKREVRLKDASNVFPGHGGFLDRIDSLIFNIPFFYLYLLYR